MLPSSPHALARPVAAGRVDPSEARARNLSLVARTVFAADHPPTRAGVAAATALTRSTVSRLVDDLVSGGLVAELDRAAEPARGRPGTPLAPAGGRHVALGLQVNVGYLAAVVVDLTGTVLVHRLVETDLRHSDAAVVLRRLEDLADEVLAALPLALAGPPPRVVGAGLALPGIVSAGAGLLLRAPNLDWSQVDVVAALDPQRLGGTVPIIGNEANLAAMTVTESRPAHPSGLRDFIYLSGETGIGGAVVIEGVPLGGRHGWAGEIGHVCVDPAGPACPCGSTGCLEQYAGKRALLGAAGLEPDAPADLLVDRVGAGDEAATAAVERAAWALGCALAGVVNIVDVPVIVLGGHLRDVAELLRPRLEATLRERVLSARWTAPTVELAPRLAAPGALGAAYVALDAVVAEPARWLP